MPPAADRHATQNDRPLGPGREPDRHQAARHQRRRLLQRELGASASRTRRRCPTSCELLAILLIPAALCYTFGRHGRRHAPGLGGARRDARDLRAAHDWRASRPSRPAIRSSPRSASISAPSRAAGRRQHGRQGDALRHRQLGALGGGDDRRFQRLGQLDARLVHAARRRWCRCGSCSSARSCSAASAAASTAC